MSQNRLEQYPEVIWTPEMVSKFWDFERLRPQAFFSFQVGAVIVRRFQRHLSKGAQVVDYGAGPGFLVEDFLTAGVRCGAVEFGDRAVVELNDKFGGMPRFMGARSNDNLGGWRQKFDGAALIEVVEHLYDAEMTAALSSIHGLLKPGGLLIVTTPNEEDRSKNFIRSPESGLLFHRYQHVRSWSGQSLKAFLEKHGFNCIETGTVDFGASIASFRRTLSLPMRILRFIAKQCLRTKKPPHLYAIARRT